MRGINKGRHIDSCRRRKEKKRNKDNAEKNRYCKTLTAVCCQRTAALGPDPRIYFLMTLYMSRKAQLSCTKVFQFNWEGALAIQASYLVAIT